MLYSITYLAPLHVVHAHLMTHGHVIEATGASCCILRQSALLPEPAAANAQTCSTECGPGAIELFANVPFVMWRCELELTVLCASVGLMLLWLPQRYGWCSA